MSLSSRSPQPASPRGPWVRVWVVGSVATLLLLGGLETFWRHRGYGPSITSYEALWSYHRARLEHAGRDTVALLGGSRMQIGFRLEAFGAVYPDLELVQLADAGKSPLVVLGDLARDESFRGLVICSIVEVTSLPGWKGQEALVRFYHQKWGPGEKYSLLLLTPLQGRFVLLQPRLRGARLLGSLADGRLPPINYYRTYFDRSRDMYFRLLSQRNLRGLVGARMARSRQFLPAVAPASIDDWKAYVGKLTRLSARIESRGGRVVLVSFPIRGLFRRQTDEYFPRAQYWDLLAAAGLETLHHEDMPGSRRLRLPDHSHLDIPSGRLFTRWIAEELAS